MRLKKDVVPARCACTTAHGRDFEEPLAIDGQIPSCRRRPPAIPKACSALQKSPRKDDLRAARRQTPSTSAAACRCGSQPVRELDRYRGHRRLRQLPGRDGTLGKTVSKIRF